MIPDEGEGKVVVHEGKEGAIHLTNTPLGSALSKRVGARYEFIRSEAREDRISITHTSSENKSAIIIIGSPYLWELL